MHYLFYKNIKKSPMFVYISSILLNPNISIYYINKYLNIENYINNLIKNDLYHNLKLSNLNINNLKIDKNLINYNHHINNYIMSR
jgi:hypothetical protein